MTTLIVYTNNLVSLGGKYVGRIDRATYDTKWRKPHVKTTFFTPKDGDRTDLSVPHVIDAALYAGGPSDWKINPAFIQEVEEILNG